MRAVIATAAEANAIPMAKLQATWITGGTQSGWAKLWEKQHGEIVYDEAVRCVPGVAPLNRCIRISAGTEKDLDLLEQVLGPALRAAAAG